MKPETWLLLASPGIALAFVMAMGALFDLSWRLRAPRRYRFLCNPVPFEQESEQGRRLLNNAKAAASGSIAAFGTAAEVAAYLAAIERALEDGSRDSLQKVHALRMVLRRSVLRR
ncbi:MAG: hypothetical protein ACYC96_15915 [Fimbriimonadaceae bacterium]